MKNIQDINSTTQNENYKKKIIIITTKQKS